MRDLDVNLTIGEKNYARKGIAKKSHQIYNKTLRKIKEQGNYDLKDNICFESKFIGISSKANRENTFSTLKISFPGFETYEADEKIKNLKGANRVILKSEKISLLHLFHQEAPTLSKVIHEDNKFLENLLNARSTEHLTSKLFKHYFSYHSQFKEKCASRLNEILIENGIQVGIWKCEFWTMNTTNMQVRYSFEMRKM